jgi:hypothetical protein
LKRHLLLSRGSAGKKENNFPEIEHNLSLSCVSLPLAVVLINLQNTRRVCRLSRNVTHHLNNLNNLKNLKHLKHLKYLHQLIP